MARSLLLVHSPLVGPSSLAALAALAREQGRDVALPDLTGVAQADPPYERWFVDTVVMEAEDLCGPIDVVAHSGAGAYLPAIAARLAARRGVLGFVDAVVPPASGAHRTPPPLRAMLDGLTDEDGRLRAWFDWWDEATVMALVPDPALRAELAADTPRVPRALYDEDVAVPDGWARWPAVYLQLGEPYDDDAALAHAYGWPVTRRDLDHLAVRTHADEVWRVLQQQLERA